VGRITQDWVDTSRRDFYAQDPEAHRRLVVWIWYPAIATDEADRALYLPEPWAPTAQFLGLDVQGRRAHAVEDAPVSDAAPRYPVLVLSPSGFPPLFMTAIAEELASHGHVVAGVNHTYETTVTVFSDGEVAAMDPAAVAGALGPQTGKPEEVFRARAAVCEHKAVDLAFVADQMARLDEDPTGRFGGRLDADRVGAIGHSFGGVASLEWCRSDPRCRAAVNLDGAIWTDIATTGLERPALQVLTEHREFDVSAEEAVKMGMAPDTDWFEAEKAVTFGGWRSLRADPVYTLRIAGATHLSFMDVPFLPAHEGSPMKSMLAATTIEPARMWRVTSDVVLAFLARHLDGAPAPLLDGPDPDYPELAYGPA
jgi:predicted dienelactone hydrolase